MPLQQFITGSENMQQAGKLMPEAVGLHWFDQLNSTNETALAGNLPQRTIIGADRQLAGRGRLGRCWFSPPGKNLYFSLILYPQLAQQYWGGFSLAAGVAMAQSLTQLNVPVALKWPNDLLLCQGKLGGILLEAQGGKLVIGIGLNVNLQQIPPELPATSLRKWSGHDWRRDKLLALAVSKLLACCSLWEQGKREEILIPWRQHDTVLGNDVELLYGGQRMRGWAQDVGPNGELLIRTDQGLQAVISGEVTLAKEKE